MLATGPFRTWIVTTAGVWLSAVLAVVSPQVSCAQEDRTTDWPPEALSFFEERIRPVLAEQCLSCHGARKQTSGLRLDSRSAILEGGLIEGPAVYLDDPAVSPLLDVLRHDSELKMPPDQKLADEVIGAFERWVQMGMPWPDDATIPTPEVVADASTTHWAFQARTDPAPPEVSDPSWIATPVDAFLRKRLDDEGITPSPSADRRTLLRRVTFDLIGLPPTPDEVEAFLQDPRSDDEAFADVVDRLLANPHYGERWGRHWLDVARYADTKGYVFTEERRYPYAYTYRDYVVRSFNEDKPFDRFILEQLAADQLDLPPGDPALAAMGYLTVGQRFLNNTHDMIDDRIDVISRGLMGLTVSCARCHDHKYDPIPTADYYSLYGVLNSSTEPDTLPLITELVDSKGPERDDFLRQLREREAAIETFLRSKRDEINSDFQRRSRSYLEATHVIQSTGELGSAGRRRDDNAIDREARARELPPRRLGAFLDKWTTMVEQSDPSTDPILAPWHALATLPPESFADNAAQMLESLSSNTALEVNPIIKAALVQPAPPATFAEVIERYAQAFSDRSEGETDQPGRSALDALFLPESGALAVASIDEAQRLLERDERNEQRNLERKAEELQVNHPGAPPRAMVMVDTEKPREPVIFVRGNPGNRGPEVPRQFLQLLEGDDRRPFSQGSGRLELAQKIADPSNPLTARVMVNRIWMHHFGQPIVGTPSDFGTRSDVPTHPELLDFLASQFVKRGWSIKEMHRLILNSRSYRQVSLDRPEATAIDPENRLLWRQNRKRLELEPMRDAMLAVSGRLDARFGGRPSPSPSVPDGTRRTLYSMIDRTFLDGVYRTFDFASTEVSNPNRPQTIVPQQALFLMNSPFMAKQARALADRCRDEAASDESTDRIRRMYQLLYGRLPEPSELELGERFLNNPGTMAEPLQSQWSYGFGRFDEDSQRVIQYQDLPHWTGNAWQFGAEFPHPEGGYLNLKAEGGHVGNGPDQAAIRRWTAPETGIVRIEGRLVHRNSNGDGVRGRIVSESSGLLGEWVAHDGRSRTVVPSFEVHAGEVVDFVVDCLETTNHDSFEWSPVVTLETSDGSQATWDSRSDFHGPAIAPPTPEEQYAQALLMTNEFLYID
ncbi:PSD1 and planctomycete cytochrome C domain-containing protein [Tautonia marina]|uniref:PSD1 and planctomycete cytochrome C domain-containing protein n=1 Tax=Tautonia marina TaxID=2653855 RepID=UPI0012608DA7|nr:PSD1 and planctomycete cytochrome C domain-containing protein [Tautonia marina]